MPRTTFDGLHLDRATGYLIVLDPYAHHAHEGDAFFWVHSSLADDTELIEVRIQTPGGVKAFEVTKIITLHEQKDPFSA